MDLYLVFNKPERLAAPEAESITASVMTELGLEAFALDRLKIAGKASFVEIATKARERGFQLYALPGARSAPQEGIVEELQVGTHTFLCRHAQDWSGQATVRWLEDDEGVRETVVPAWLVQSIAQRTDKPRSGGQDAATQP